MPKFFCFLALVLSMTSHASATEWATAVSKHQSEDRAIVFRYVSSFAPEFNRVTQPQRVILLWRYESTSGMPSREERERMESLEDTLSPVVENDGFATLALVSTGENSREWIYYAKSEDEFMERLNAALGHLPAFPVEIHASPDPTWDTYENFRSGLDGGSG